jgi:hypothetical protein
MNLDTSILWRREDRPGHEHARLVQHESDWLLSGVALFEHDGLPCNLAYSVRCNPTWATRHAHVTGRVGNREVNVEIAADAAGNWTLNGETCAEVSGAIDVDLNFSPSTNLLPIRRLNLGIGQRAEVRAAWLRFPSFRLELLAQSYTRTGERSYVYESGGGSFVARLDVGEAGWPLAYAGIWSSEATS